MSSPIYFDEEFKAKWRYAFEQARADRERYFSWLKDEINKAVELINKYDKIYVLGGLGARLLQASPNIYNQFIADYDGPDQEEVEKDEIIEDDEIEVLLEYCMNIASSRANENEGVIPTINDINKIRDLLSSIKFNVGFYELSADKPSDGTEMDHWLKLRVMEEAIHVRGDGYQSHIQEVYSETFAFHDNFLEQYYGFNSINILETIQHLNLLVASKIGNVYGAGLAYKRFVEWSEGKKEIRTKKKINEHSISMFIEANPDLSDKSHTEGVFGIPYDYVNGYNRLFWVIPKSDKEKRIFEQLSHNFGDNSSFMSGKFGGFPLGDSVIHRKPLIKYNEKYYCFSSNLAFRNIFNITGNLLQSADEVYYQHKFKGNASRNSRDNYIEIKVKQLFEKFLPNVRFYHSLKYSIVENGINKLPELDILGIGDDTIYIIEVKAGELNKKHRRGAILGLKDRLKETVNEGSYQCYRAEKHINNSENPEFIYIENKSRQTLTINNAERYNKIKISITYEHLSSVSVNLKYLIESGVLSPDYKWTWIASLYDLMIFADLIESEHNFKEYLNYRFGLYERSDIEFNDEIDILGFYFENKFPLPPEKADEIIFMISYKDEIEAYYNRKDVGMPLIKKPKKKRRLIDK